MTSPKIVAFIVATLAQTAAVNAHWTERYFGVGSAEERTLACQEARGHADGNSINACVGKRGTRGEAEYTECVCSLPADGEHVCNVNVKVVCEGGTQPAEKSSSIGDRGEPKGRVVRTVSGRGPRARRERPGLEAPNTAEGRWTGDRR
jgi:hypothetical protein